MFKSKKQRRRKYRKSIDYTASNKGYKLLVLLFCLFTLTALLVYIVYNVYLEFSVFKNAH